MKLRPLLARLDAIADFLQSPLLLVIRLYWGWQFAQTGWGKLTHLERTAGYFESLNLPLPKVNAIMAGATECFGGVLLALGLFARPASMRNASPPVPTRRTRNSRTGQRTAMTAQLTSWPGHNRSQAAKQLTRAVDVNGTGHG